ncbi:MAG: hypothetical protein PHH54_04980 [Candidatus Nanoarchaeia archaeon]|nr:hypothetical protein [Candidatus Nanoarchaeia archaeon]MDD5741312.1 hypothetical protein [Candidatus Nanoarchaeia archaeon]
MIIKTKYKTGNGPRKVKNQVHIEEIMINEDMVNPKNEKFEIAFRNNSTSGLIEFRPDEIERLIKTIGDKAKLIKSVKIIRG